MPTYQVKIADHNYIVVATDIEEAMRQASTEDEHREGVTVPISAMKEMDARVVGIREADIQPKLWPQKEA